MKSKPTNAATIHGSVTKCAVAVDKRPSRGGLSGVAMCNPVEELRRRAALTREQLNLEARMRAEGV